MTKLRRPYTWTTSFRPFTMSADRRPDGKGGHCPSCGLTVVTVLKIGTWSGGNIDGDPSTGTLYAAECVSCDAVLTGSAPTGTSVKDLEWRVER